MSTRFALKNVITWCKFVHKRKNHLQHGRHIVDGRANLKGAVEDDIVEGVRRGLPHQRDIGVYEVNGLRCVHENCHDTFSSTDDFDLAPGINESC